MDAAAAVRDDLTSHFSRLDDLVSEPSRKRRILAHLYSSSVGGVSSQV
jgi:hypothetical protein